MKFAGVFVVLLCPALVMAQAYKCMVDGQTVFQQIPCEGGVKLNVPSPPNPKTREGRVALAIERGQVFIGMTEEEVVASWGRPSKINRSQTARSISEQWIYRRASIGDDQYLYLENGVLRSIQTPVN